MYNHTCNGPLRHLPTWRNLSVDRSAPCFYCFYLILFVCHNAFFRTYLNFDVKALKHTFFLNGFSQMWRSKKVPSERLRSMWRSVGKRDFSKRLTWNFKYILYLKFDVNVLRSTRFPMEDHKRVVPQGKNWNFTSTLWKEPVEHHEQYHSVCFHRISEFFQTSYTRYANLQQSCYI